MSVHTIALLSLKQLMNMDPQEWKRTLVVSPAYVYHTYRFLFERELSRFDTLWDAVQADVREQVQAQLQLVLAEQSELRRCERLALTICATASGT
jgi:hypothetical protein